jgi:dUTPase
LAWKHSIDVGAGVVDEDYRGPVGVILFNHGDKDFEGELAWALYRDEFAGHGLF